MNVKIDNDTKSTCTCKIRKELTEFVLNLLKNKGNDKLTERDLRYKVDGIIRKVKNDLTNKIRNVKLNEDECIVKKKFIELLNLTERNNVKLKKESHSKIPVLIKESKRNYLTPNGVRVKIKEEKRCNTKIPINNKNYDTKRDHRSVYVRKKVVEVKKNYREDDAKEVALILTNLRVIIREREIATKEDIWKYRDVNDSYDEDLHFVTVEFTDNNTPDNDHSYCNNDDDDGIEDLRLMFNSLCIV